MVRDDQSRTGQGPLSGNLQRKTSRDCCARSMQPLGTQKKTYLPPAANTKNREAEKHLRQAEEKNGYAKASPQGSRDQLLSPRNLFLAAGVS